MNQDLIFALAVTEQCIQSSHMVFFSYPADAVCATLSVCAATTAETLRNTLRGKSFALKQKGV